MPDATVQIAPSIAKFLAVGAPAAPEAPGKGAFAAVLAKQVDDTAPATAKQTGKILPGKRQEPAIPVLPVVDEENQVGPKKDVDFDSGIPDVPDTAPKFETPKPIQPMIALFPEPQPTPRPINPKHAVSERDVRPDMPTTDTPPVGTVSPKPIVPVQPVVVPLPAPAEGVPGFGKLAMGQGHVDPIRVPEPPVLPARNPLAETLAATAPQPAAQPDAQSAMQPVAVAPDAAFALEAQPELKPVLPVVDKSPVQPRDTAPVLPAPKPVDARSLAFVVRADPAAEPLALKPRQRVGTTYSDLTIATGTQPTDIRMVTATTAAAPADALGADRVTSLIETIETLRSEAADDGRLDIAIDHSDFGPLSVRFEHGDDGVVVQFDTRDADLARMIADSAPDLKAAGDPLGMRFERRDTLSANSGGSGDAQRHGREPATRDTNNYRPQARQERDRGGIFA